MGKKTRIKMGGGGKGNKSVDLFFWWKESIHVNVHSQYLHGSKSQNFYYRAAEKLETGSVKQMRW